jgi:hypothetical protein
MYWKANELSEGPEYSDMCPKCKDDISFCSCVVKKPIRSSEVQSEKSADTNFLVRINANDANRPKRASGE